MYEKCLKRVFDFCLSLFGLIILSPLFLILTVIGAVVMKGNPFFIQKRPGRINKKTGKEQMFPLIKLRTMSEQKESGGKLLSDEERLNPYGRWLRSISFDEMPSLICIMAGWMSWVGPRPFLIRDLVFMTERERRRHMVRPGFVGLAIAKGRNRLNWEQKFEYDLKYIDDGITFIGDLKIMAESLKRFMKLKEYVRDGENPGLDYGHWLLTKGAIDRETFDRKLKEAEVLARG